MTKAVIDAISELLPKVVDTIKEALESTDYKPRQRLPRPPRKIGAPAARTIFDKRPSFYRVRSTI